MVCRWKGAARILGRIRRNKPEKIEKVTKEAFKTRFEKKKMELLTSLHGVDFPVASAILMLTDPWRYGVIDIRAWQVLYQMGAVKTNPSGKKFKFKEWYRYLMILRRFAKRYGVKARDIERTLFQIHKKYQKGTLYD